MELSEAINKRASVRFYQEREVEKEKLKELIEAAIRAPTASGLENWLFVIYKSKEVREKVYKLILEGHLEYYKNRGLSEEKMKKLKQRFEEGMYKAPVYIGVFINKEVNVLKCEKYSELEFYWTIESAAMAIQNLMLKAVELDLGTCYIGVANFPYIEEELKEIAGLDEKYFLVGLITVGYPAREEIPRKRRKSVEEVSRFV